MHNSHSPEFLESLLQYVNWEDFEDSPRGVLRAYYVRVPALDYMWSVAVPIERAIKQKNANKHANYVGSVKIRIKRKNYRAFWRAGLWFGQPVEAIMIEGHILKMRTLNDPPPGLLALDPEYPHRGHFYTKNSSGQRWWISLKT